MDFFYKPPVQRRDECKALEENYINCLLQKALKDRVFNNRCVKDSILWFHLECPKAADTFNDPDTFKLKFRDFFAHLKVEGAAFFESTELETRVRNEYGSNVGPDHVTFKPEADAFVLENREHSPALLSDDDLDNDVEGINGLYDKAVDVEYRNYAPDRVAPPLTVEDSAKFGSASKVL